MAVYGGSILVDDTKILEWGLEASNGACICVVVGMVPTRRGNAERCVVMLTYFLTCTSHHSRNGF